MNIWDLGTFQRLKRLTTVYSEITFPNEANRHPNCRMFSRKEKKNIAKLLEMRLAMRIGVHVTFRKCG